MTVEATFWLLCRPRQLPCIEDAWNIPISQEMASRQNNQQNRATAGVAGVAGNAATTQRANSGYGSGGGPQQQVYGYPAVSLEGTLTFSFALPRSIVVSKTHRHAVLVSLWFYSPGANMLSSNN